MIAIPGTIAVFDYGEVISTVPSPADRTALMKLAGVEGPEFWESYWRHRDALDQGTISVKEYWTSIGLDLGSTWNTARLHQLWLMDFRSWLAVDPDVLDVLIELQKGGTRMALLSNAGPDFTSYYRCGLIGDFFERVFTSGEMGILKPDPAIYEALIAGLDVPPDRIIFIDNKRENVAGAQALGIVAHHFTSARNLRSYLERSAAAAAQKPGASL